MTCQWRYKRLLITALSFKNTEDMITFSDMNCVLRASTSLPPEAPAKLMSWADIALIGLH